MDILVYKSSGKQVQLGDKIVVHDKECFVRMIGREAIQLAETADGPGTDAASLEAAGMVWVGDPAPENVARMERLQRRVQDLDDRQERLVTVLLELLTPHIEELIERRMENLDDQITDVVDEAIGNLDIRVEIR